MIENPALRSGLRGITGEQFFNKAIPTIVTLLLTCGVFAFLLFFVLGALRWIAAKGDSNELKAAHDQVMNALIGICVMFALFAFLKAVGKITGITGLEDLRLVIPEI